MFCEVPRRSYQWLLPHWQLQPCHPWPQHSWTKPSGQIGFLYWLGSFCGKQDICHLLVRMTKKKKGILCPGLFGKIGIDLTAPVSGPECKLSRGALSTLGCLSSFALLMRKRATIYWALTVDQIHGKIAKYFCLPSQQHCKVDVAIPVSCPRKARPREIRSGAHSHSA